MQRGIVICALLMAVSLALGACGLAPSPTIPSAPSPTAPMPTPTAAPNLPDALPNSLVLGKTLTGSGDVSRSVLTYDDLMTGASLAPVDDSAFAPPLEAASTSVRFEGRLDLSGEAVPGGFESLRDDLNYGADPLLLRLPSLSLVFVQDGSYLIPVKQGLVITGDPYWNTIVGPGRIWRENGDRGYARASFPFALVERNQNCTHNGVMTFLFDGQRISNVRYQITQETCLYFKFNMWGQLPAAYTPIAVPEADTLQNAYAAEVAGRLPTRPLAALATDFPSARVDLASFGAGVTPEHMTAYGLLLNEVNYIAGCRTRFGQYAYCESLRLPSYSTAKSSFAAVALMRLGQKYGPQVYDLLVKDYVPGAQDSQGDWSTVTFAAALDMTTGNYTSAGFEADEDGPTEAAFLDAESSADKIRIALDFPNQEQPGRVWIYHTSDTFLLTVAMNHFLIGRQGPGADIFNLVRDEVYKPLGLSAGALTSLRTDNSPDGIPFGGYGLFWTLDDIAKLSMLLNDWHGAIGGEQVLEPGLLAAALQQDPARRGLLTTGVPAFNYKAGFWAREWTPAEARQYTCRFWTPFISGYGGISVVLMPNGAAYYYFSDNNEFAWYDAVNAANQLKPMCP